MFYRNFQFKVEKCVYSKMFKKENTADFTKCPNLSRYEATSKWIYQRTFFANKYDFTNTAIAFRF